MNGKVKSLGANSNCSGFAISNARIVESPDAMAEARREFIEAGESLRRTVHRAARGNGPSDAEYTAYRAAKARLDALTQAA